jgi:hypothetical protein
VESRSIEVDLKVDLSSLDLVAVFLYFAHPAGWVLPQVNGIYFWDADHPIPQMKMR